VSLGRIVVFLSGTRGLHTLEALVRSSHGVEAAVTPGETPLTASIVKLGISHLRLEDINSPAALDALRRLQPQLFVIAGYSAIFKQPLLDLPLLGTINLHAGRLPQYRGGSPLNWQLINGEYKAGISVLRVGQRIDAGPVLASAEIPIGPHTTIETLHDAANNTFPRLLMDALGRVECGEIGEMQDEGLAQYWCQRNDADGYLPFARLTAMETDRMIRALTRPYPGAWCCTGSGRVRLFAAKIPELTVNGPPGRICYIQGKGPYVLCADRAIMLTDYEIEGNGRTTLRHGAYVS
jgi:methionyl-tRNA formyltransferase